MKPGEKMRKGLVLEGGAMRGMFTAGALDVLMENGIDFDCTVGVSAGAVFGCNLKSKQIGRAIRYNLKYSKNWRYCSVRSLLLTGDLYGAKFCYDTLPFELDKFDLETFKNNPMEFYAVCTNVNTATPIYKRIYNCDKEEMKWFRASASLPLVSKIVEINGEDYLDGGITDSIPLKFLQTQNCDRNVAILTQPIDYRKSPANVSMFKFSLRKYPKMLEAMKNRHIMYNKQVEYVISEEKVGNVFVIRPSKPLSIKRTENDPEKLKAVYEIGRETMTERLEELKKYLNL